MNTASKVGNKVSTERGSRGLKVRTGVKAAGLSGNHNARPAVRSTRG